MHKAYIVFQKSFSFKEMDWKRSSSIFQYWVVKVTLPWWFSLCALHFRELQYVSASEHYETFNILGEPVCFMMSSDPWEAKRQSGDCLDFPKVSKCFKKFGIIWGSDKRHTQIGFPLPNVPTVNILNETNVHIDVNLHKNPVIFLWNF